MSRTLKIILWAIVLACFAAAFWQTCSAQTVFPIVSPSTAAYADTIVFDAASSATWATDGSVEWTHNVTGVVTNGIIVVAFDVWWPSSEPTISSVTVGGVAATSIKSQSYGGGNNKLYMYYYKSASLSGSYTIAVTMSTACEVGGTAISLGGVHQTTAIGTAVSTLSGSGTIGLSTTTVAGDWVVSGLGYYNATPTDDFGQTRRVTKNNFATYSSVLESTEKVTTTTTVTGYTTAGLQAALIAVPVKGD